MRAELQRGRSIPAGLPPCTWQSDSPLVWRLPPLTQHGGAHGVGDALCEAGSRLHRIPVLQLGCVLCGSRSSAASCERCCRPRVQGWCGAPAGGLGACSPWGHPEVPAGGRPAACRGEADWAVLQAGTGLFCK